MIFSCSQDPIFWNISKETAPVKPRIAGSPTKMLELNNIMYVASGDTLYRYNNGSWDSLSKPGGRIMDIAATSNTLYALCLNDAEDSISSVLKQYTGGGWSNISNSSGYSLIETIYADPDDTNNKLFAGASKNGTIITRDYGILHLDGNTLKDLTGNTGLLSGAAYDTNTTSSTYYLCTKGSGVYKYKSDLTTQTQFEGSRIFMGMIKLKLVDNSKKIIVVERDGGTLYMVDTSGGLTSTGKSTGKYATGALALWQEGSDRILTAGIQENLSSSSSTLYTNGYVEFYLTLNDSSSFTIGDRMDPPTYTIRRNPEQYASSIGKLPINHFYQASDGVFFASTQAKGLWSYRDRSGGWQWNAEN